MYRKYLNRPDKQRSSEVRSMDFYSLILGICLSCLVHLLPAQTNLVFENKKNGSLQYNHVDSPADSQKAANYIIEEIAKSIPKQFKYTEYIFNYLLVSRVYRTSHGQYEASIEVVDADCSGDVIYKGFSIAGVLVPTSLDVSFEVSDRTVLPLAKGNFRSVSLNAGYNKIGTLSFADTTALPAFNFTYTQLNFRYGEHAGDTVKKRMKLVDDYYLTEFIIDACHKELNDFDFSDIDRIIIYDIHLSDVEKTLEGLYNRDFPGKLNLTMNDPVDFLNKFNKLSGEVISVREQMDQFLATLDRLYYNKGLELLEKKEIQQARYYFTRSVTLNPYFAPSHYELARLLFRHDSIEQAADILSFILQKANPDHITHKLVINLSDSVYSKLLVRGNDYLATEKYNEALSAFQHCYLFCSSSPGLVCDNEVFRGLANSKFGIFRSYLSVAQKALDNGKFEFAELYIEESRKYQRENSSEIIGDAEADDMEGKLARAYIARGDTLLNRKSYEKALGMYARADSIYTRNDGIPRPNDLPIGIRRARVSLYNQKCNNARQYLKSGNIALAESEINSAIEYQTSNISDIPSSTNSDTILARIKLIQYNETIKEGIVLLDAGNLKEALRKFDLAEQLEEKFLFRRNLRLDTLLSATALPLIKYDLDEALRLTRVDVDSAQIVYERVTDWCYKYHLAGDNELLQEIEELQLAIFNKKCDIAGTEFDTIYSIALSQINSKNYISAILYLDSAYTLCEAFKQCGIPQNDIIVQQQLYRNAALYQQMMVETEKLLFKNDFKGFLVGYVNAEIFYNSFDEISGSGIAHLPLAEYLKSTKDTGLILAAAEFYIISDPENTDPRFAFEMICRAKTLGYSSDNCSLMLQKIGVALAALDKKEYPFIKAHNRLIGYGTGRYWLIFWRNDQWFKVFNQSYLKLR